MSEHEWCRDTARDEAVRAAEDAAAVPSIQHRDLPDEVALLRASLTDILGRVVRLEAEMDAGEDEDAAPAAGGPEPRGWLTAEERQAIQWLASFARNVCALPLPYGKDGSSYVVTAHRLLARESPPRVKVPPWLHADVRGVVIAAIREAGGEVEE